jgi:hypothetical protein
MIIQMAECNVELVASEPHLLVSLEASCYIANPSPLWQWWMFGSQQIFLLQ